jgi:hypothetical protein
MVRRVVIAAAVIAVIALGGALYRNARWARPSSVIRQELLRETPIGSSRDFVQAILTRKSLESEAGTFFPSEKVERETVNRAHVVLTSDIATYYTFYTWMPWRTDVFAYWVFDVNGELLEITVRKQVDAP